jgi:hypothetical protein
VPHGAGPSHGHAIPFGDQFVDSDMNLSEGTVELAVDVLEGLRPDEDGVGLGETVGFALWVEEFVDSGLFALIPDYFEPASCEGLIRS